MTHKKHFLVFQAFDPFHIPSAVMKPKNIIALKIWIWELEGKKRKTENASYTNRISNAESLWNSGA